MPSSTASTVTVPDCDHQAVLAGDAVVAVAVHGERSVAGDGQVAGAEQGGVDVGVLGVGSVSLSVFWLPSAQDDDDLLRLGGGDRRAGGAGDVDAVEDRA